VTFAAYTGHETLTFSDYLDMGTGRTLRAEPGQVYDIIPASGRLVADVPEAWFTRTEPAVDEAAPEAAAESVTEPGADEPPAGTDEPQPQQF
jgi:hypothetical protein